MDDEDVSFVEQLDPSTTGGQGSVDILKMNIGRQMDRINRAFDSLDYSAGNEAIVFMKAATHIKILDAMMNHKAGREYKKTSALLLDNVEKYEEEITHPPDGKLGDWWYYLRPLMKWYSIECSELSNLGLIPYDKQGGWIVESKPDEDE
jgi:hypothetical protein